MRFLLACASCRRQLDVTGHAVGARLRCSCGAELTVPQPRGHDAAVVRCSSCGAPRQGREGDGDRCRYCNSELTLHDRDLDTLCPGCMARVSGRARFCHFCAIPILSAQAVSPETAHSCPACPEKKPLASRRLGRANVAVFECNVCGGLWIEKEIFEVLADRARAGQMPDLGLVGQAGPRPAGTVQKGRLYRPCVLCGTLMNRRNYGRKSAVIVDVCSRHGVWFDLHELDHLLRWIREGGEERVRALQAQEEKAEARQKALAKGIEPIQVTRGRGDLFSDGGLVLVDLLIGGLSSLGDLFDP
jgi:Zn-finger nucleic acid-binding protein